MFSIDDLYLPHSFQKSLADSQPRNPLVQHRGQPSTHDILLGKEVFSQLASRKPNVRIPSFDKSLYDGQGDRTDSATWKVVNRDGEPPVEVVIFEGWCVGFKSLGDTQLEYKWELAKAAKESHNEAYTGRLALLELEHLSFVDNALRQYDVLTSCVLEYSSALQRSLLTLI